MQGSSDDELRPGAWTPQNGATPGQGAGANKKHTRTTEPCLHEINDICVQLSIWLCRETNLEDLNHTITVDYLCGIRSNGQFLHIFIPFVLFIMNSYWFIHFLKSNNADEPR